MPVVNRYMAPKVDTVWPVGLIKYVKIPDKANTWVFLDKSPIIPWSFASLQPPSVSLTVSGGRTIRDCLIF